MERRPRRTEPTRATSRSGPWLVACGLLLLAAGCGRRGAAGAATDAAAHSHADVASAAAETTAAAESPPGPGDADTTSAADAAAMPAEVPGPDAADGGAVDAPGETALDTAGLPPAEAELLDMLRSPCPRPAPDDPPEPAASFESELKCTGPPPSPDEGYEACEHVLDELSDRLESQRAEVLALLRDRKFIEARRSLASWLNRHPCPDGCGVPPRVERLARDIEVAFAADGAVADLDGTWLERPVRVYLRDDVQARTRPAGDARLSHGYSLHQNTAFDAWAFVPGGWVLLADPLVAPAFRVRDPPTGADGWVLACRLVLEPIGPRVLDVGHPLAILRPPAAGVPFEDPAGGKPCTRGGRPGREYVMWSDERSECFPFVELCGGPGLTPPTWELKDADEEGCDDCCTNTRCVVVAGDYCRAAEPGWVWRCSPDDTQLVCGPPAES